MASRARNILQDKFAIHRLRIVKRPASNQRIAVFRPSTLVLRRDLVSVECRVPNTKFVNCTVQWARRIGVISNLGCSCNGEIRNDEISRRCRNAGTVQIGLVGNMRNRRVSG